MNKQSEMLHAVWCRQTGVHVPMTFDNEYTWATWRKEIEAALERSDWPKTTPEELLMVVIRRRFRIGGSPTISRAWTRLHRILRDPSECLEHFAEEMAEQRRQPVYPPGKVEVLRATGRPDEPDLPPPRPAAAAIESMLEQLKEAAR